MIGWLDLHQGFVLALLTAVYVATTLYMAARMKKSTELSEKSTRAALEAAEQMREANKLSLLQLEQAHKIERLRSRPYLVFDLESRRRLMHAVLRNIGETPALDVSIDVQPELYNDSMKARSSLVGNPIRMVAPGREFTDVINSSPGFYAQYEKPVFKVLIRYSDAAGELYQESVSLDMTFAGTLVSFGESPDVGEELQRIRKVLEQG